MNKPREFWIKDFIVFKTHDKYSDGASVREAYDKPAPNRQIHVIEYDQYKKLDTCLNAIDDHIRKMRVDKIITMDEMIRALKVISDNLK